MESWYEEDVSRSKQEKRMVFFVVSTVLVVFALCITLGLVVGVLTSFDEIIYEDPVDPPFYQSITQDALNSHLQEFQTIAGQYANSRSVNNGYNASVDYVKSQLEANTNYNVYQQYFTVSEMVYSSSSLQQVSPVVQAYEEGTDYLIIEYSPSGTVTDVPVFAIGSSGCFIGNFDGFIAGSAALIQDSELCLLDVAVTNAEQSGAVFVLVQNGIKESKPYSGELSSSTTSNIPVMGINYLIGVDLSSALKPNISAIIEGSEQISYTSNLIAETASGNPDSIIIIGSHLDSVPAGPGINDNGSGSSVNLELAIQTYQKGIALENKIIFAWWGAEELGLLGSSYYVENLTKEDKNKIQVNLNYDMLASSNFFRGVYNGSEATEPITQSCTKIAQIYESFFLDQNLQYLLTEFNGRSDYGPFLEANITAGGLKTGSNGVKSIEERDIFGGFAQAIHDPCYHQSCDTMENINQEILMENAQAAANILQVLAGQENLHTYLFG